ncbi:hypothetical protein PR202_ga10865 [Eleusine coracana subsp. coracana]|uniref:Uncharacterized protein n=1 Tax=Eleusine coracana subsp. coracana TaxID=191504 RepID=A0AAV5C824_ELECO|nr:hypothetical protein PR202_ga10865 [Eleusine coracana subsp. coracana]
MWRASNLETSVYPQELDNMKEFGEDTGSPQLSLPFILAMDINRENYELGLLCIEKAIVANMNDFREGPALRVLDQSKFNMMATVAAYFSHSSSVACSFFTGHVDPPIRAPETVFSKALMALGSGSVCGTSRHHQHGGPSIAELVSHSAAALGLHGLAVARSTTARRVLAPPLEGSSSSSMDLSGATPPVVPFLNRSGPPLVHQTSNVLLCISAHAASTRSARQQVLHRACILFKKMSD